MDKDLHNQIRMLEDEILKEEIKINNALKANTIDLIKKSLDVIDSDLKYLSILVNGAPIDKNENMKVMEFIRIHHENMWNLSLPA